MSVRNPWDGLELFFERRYISAFFNLPYRMLSSCRVYGGLRDDLECACNHQICEPQGHMSSIPPEACAEPGAYLKTLTSGFGLPERTALLTTAANVQCAGEALEEFNKQRVLAVVTAGVDGNAARAGDPASYAESAGQIVALAPGTINIMLFLNTPLLPGAMLEGAMLAAEAKTSVLQELSVPSLYSSGLATGTGTDGLILAAPLQGVPLTNAGKHAKTGEMIGRAVRGALFAALARQNSLLPSLRCNLFKLLWRFGLDEGALFETASELLDTDTCKLLRSNLISIVTDPPASAAAAALAHLGDQFAWGVIPENAYDDLLLDYAALLAVRAGGRVERQAVYRKDLSGLASAKPQKWNLARAAAAALVLGYSDKWN